MVSVRQHSFQAICLLISFTFFTYVESAGNVSALLPLITTNYGTAFDFEIEVGGQTFRVPPDTGSADHWILVDGYECKRPQGTVSGHTVSQETCNYGKATYTESPSFTPIDNVYLGEHYGFGNDFGIAGYETIRVGNITIPQQQMGFVNWTSDLGDGLDSGNFGIGYAELGAFHPVGYKANSSVELLENRILYNTPILNMAQQGMEPYVSFALERIPPNQLSGFGMPTLSLVYAFRVLTVSGGYLGFGTLPPVPHGEFASTPVEITEGIPKHFTNGTRRISEWSLTVQGLKWSDKTSTTPFQAVVDTANWLNMFSKDIADKINADFNPPAKYEGSLYTVACNATPPSDFGMQIGGTMFSVDPVDMIWRDASGTCYSSIAAAVPGSGISLMFVGDVFLKNVVAVFDFGNDEMRFAQRTNGTSSSPVPSTVPSSNVGTSSSTVHIGGLLLVALTLLPSLL